MKFENIRVMNFEGALRGMRNPKNSWHLADSKFDIGDSDCMGSEVSDVASSWLEFLNEDLNNEDKRTEIEDWLLSNGVIDGGNLCDCYQYAFIGPKDMKLAQQLIRGGSEHRKFLRQIQVSVDITAPLYWWKEFDTYKVGTTANSTSTMHKITAKPITLDCFEIDNMSDLYELDNEHNMGKLEAEDENFRPIWTYDDAHSFPYDIVAYCEDLRQKYLKTRDYRYWKELIRWLPESWLQTRTVTMNYENILSMLHQRKFHKLDEWSGTEEDGVLTPTFIKFIEALPYANHFLAFLEIYNCDEVPLIDFS